MSTLAEAADARSGRPPFRRIAIIGFGLIGGSIALAVRRRWPPAVIIAVDRHEVVQAAMRMNAADAGGNDLAAASGADLILLAAPVRTNIELLAALEAHVPGDALVTDVGSTKRDMAAAARRLPERLRYIGGHPLSGGAAGGVAEARADLFEGRPWILTPAGTVREQDLAMLSSFTAALGGTVQVMTPEAHDTLFAYVSHLPQLTVAALMRVVGEHAGEEGLALAGPGLRDTTRLATSPSDIWRDIAATNPDRIGAAIDDLIAVLQELKPAAADGGTAIDRTFASAAQWRRVLERTGEPP